MNHNSWVQLAYFKYCYTHRLRVALDVKTAGKQTPPGKKNTQTGASRAHPLPVRADRQLACLAGARQDCGLIPISVRCCLTVRRGQ